MNCATYVFTIFTNSYKLAIDLPKCKIVMNWHETMLVLDTEKLKSMEAQSCRYKYINNLTNTFNNK